MGRKKVDANKKGAEAMLAAAAGAPSSPVSPSSAGSSASSSPRQLAKQKRDGSSSSSSSSPLFLRVAEQTEVDAASGGEKSPVATSPTAAAETNSITKKSLKRKGSLATPFSSSSPKKSKSSPASSPTDSSSSSAAPPPPPAALKCALPPLQDPLQLAVALATTDRPISPTSSLGFVRRSTRTKRAPSPTIYSSPEVVTDSHRCFRGDQPLPALRSRLQSSFPAIGGDIRLSLNQDPQKGLCVSTNAFIQEHAFVLEYAGDLLTEKESKQMEDKYYEQHTLTEVGCYMFWIKFKRKIYCIDSTCPGPNLPPGSNLPEHLQPPASEQATPASPVSLRELSPPSPTAAAASSSHTSSAASAASSSSSSPSPSSPRLETLGYGFARYINHSRTPNLYARVVDCPSPFIRTNRFDAERQEERKEHIRETQQKQKAKKQQQQSTGKNDSSSSPPSSSLSSVPLNLQRSYPRLCFFAKRPICGGEELTIDYGDRDKESLRQFPWLQ